MLLLNQPQQQAVEHTRGALLVLAGAGSGKTRVITTRIARLLHTTPAESIVALTFTNKAAREMRERVVEEVGRKRAKGLIISTFHSLGVRILRQHIERLGYKKNFSIYAGADQIRLVRDLLPQRNTSDGKSLDAEIILQRISSAKSRLIGPEDFSAPEYDEFAQVTALVYPRYQQALKACNAIDFDDILSLCIELFHAHPKVLQQYRTQFEYIMVDEYQDTNHVQYHLLRELCGPQGNICVVGDDDQSIYGWRGAQAGNILDFEEDFSSATVIKLEQNYRSSANILTAANFLIQHNATRHDKHLWTSGDAGAPVRYLCCDDGEDEATTIIDEIHALRSRHNYTHRDFAILYRTNGQSRIFEEQLRFANIPYVLIGGQQFFDRREVRDTLAYLKVLANPADEVNLLRILNYPRRGIGETTAQRLITLSLEREIPLWELMQDPELADHIGEKATERVQAFIQLMLRYKRLFNFPDQLLGTAQNLFEEIGLEEELYRQADDPKQARRRVENMHEVINALASYIEREGIATLSGFLEKVSLLDRDEPGRNTKEEKLQQDAVVLMSLHSSKGLEFPCVFLVGMEEGTLPHSKVLEEGGDIAEERRLCYVGITRAREHLILTGASQRKRYGRMHAKQPSRFLNELPQEIIATTEEEPDPEEQEQRATDFFAQMQAMLQKPQSDDEQG
ncbi:MAG: ATP-dependent helicase [Thermodesulfobacteriota bacterium]